MDLRKARVNRSDALTQLQDRSVEWEVLVIGGGATGLGAAVDAAARGYRTVLLEQSDFAKATSSRSTKLIHGGLRYLRQGNLPLVRESLRERALLLRNAPHLVHPLRFILPNYAWWEAPYYGAGLKLYDLLAGKSGVEQSRRLTREETLRHLPTLKHDRLRGSFQYFDGQFDDARLAICLAQTVFDVGGIALNYVRVNALLKQNGRVCGVKAQDVETGREMDISARAVVNATGVFADAVRHLDEPSARTLVTPSQGAHIVLDGSFLPGDSGLMIPKTDDGRVLFAIPWHGRAVIGTTDTPVDLASLEPKPLSGEIEFLLDHAARCLNKMPVEGDVLSAFAGLRPLVKPDGARRTSSISRDHAIVVSRSGLITITGGKWTTYRNMARRAVDRAVEVGGLRPLLSPTRTLRLHGWSAAEPQGQPGWRGGRSWDVYGADAAALTKLVTENPSWNKPLHPRLPCRAVEVVWAARHEMAHTVEDVLARRTRALILDARASIHAAPLVAALLAAELGRDGRWEEEQAFAFQELARGYLPGS